MARLEIDEGSVEATAEAPHGGRDAVTHPIVGPKPLWRRALPVVLGILATGVLTSVGWWTFRPSTTPLTITRFPFTLAEGQQLTQPGRRQQVAISPDGTQMVYVANQRLYLRSMSELEARPIPGTENTGVVNPIFSPDGRSTAFWSGADQTLATGTGVEWDKAQIVAQTLRSGEQKTLIEGGSDARYLPSGHLVYALGGVLFAVPFDLTRLEVTGGPVPIVEGVRRSVDGSTGTAHFSVSHTGSLIYLPGPTSTTVAQSDLALIDRKGAVELLKLPSGAYQFPRVSPDGKRVAFATDDGKEAIVWIYDLSGTSSMRRLTFGGKNRFPIWSADGERVAFQSDREGDLGIFWQRADGTGTAERLTKPDQGTSHVSDSWSPKGERFLFGLTKGSNVSLWTFSLQDKKAAPFGAVQSSVPITSVFSPDGRWVVYSSRETGGYEIYVQPFPSTGAKYQVSKNGTSIHPLWSPDGKELFYSAAVGQFGVVSVTTQPSFTFGNLVSIPRPFVALGPTFAREFDITPDGKRFMAVVAAGQTESGAPAAPQVQVVLNWTEELKQRVPTK